MVIIDIAWNDPWLDVNANYLLKLLEKMNNKNIRVINIGKPKLDSSLYRSFIDIYPDGSYTRSSGNISPKFVLLRESFGLAKPKKPELFKGVVFLTMGGTDPLNLIKNAIEQISKSKFVKHVFILSSNKNISHDSIRDFFAKSEKKCTFLINVDEEKIIKFMKKSDFVITAFGTTAFEAMSLRLPVIAVTHYNHQDNSAKWFSDLKAIDYLGCAEKSIFWDNLKRKIDYFFKNQKIAINMATKGNFYIDGKGNERVAGAIKQIYDETFYDLDDLFIFAHPGTEALTTGGLISKLAKSGKKIGIVVMGDGISSRIKSTSKKTSISKMHADLEEAFEKSCNVLGVKVKYFFRYPDNQFDSEPLLGFVKNIEIIIERHKPKCIWTHEDSGINIDHKIIHKAVMIASRPTTGSKTIKVIGFRSPGSNDWSFANSSISKDNWYEEVDLNCKSRVKSYKLYKDINYFNHNIHSLKYINSLLKINGKKIGVTAAETFYLIRNFNRL